MASIKILLADDSITIQKVVGIIFGGDEYSLTMVSNGSAAIEKAREIHPDVMLVDVLMPGMSGYELCEAIRREPALSTTPILMLAGSFEPFDEDKARTCGANDYIIKPFESQQIVAKVKELHEMSLQVPLTAPDDNISEPPSFMETVAPAAEPPSFESTIQQSPAFEPDDPWGAFTPQPESAPEPAPVTDIADEASFEDAFSDSVMPDVMEMLQDDSVPQDSNIGASWVPSEEQTFEFREEVALVPSEALGNPFELDSQMPEPAPVFDPAAFEPTAPVEPVVETVAEVPRMTEVAAAPVAEAPALTEEQLKAAIMAASKETIERIVWEVVPDLAETMIKEAIKRITESK